MSFVFGRITCLVMILSLTLGSSSYSGQVKSTENFGGQITSDIVGAGISIAASLSGSTAFALSAGLLSKYVTTYGIAGVKSLVDLYKGRTPRDLGEINLYYIYLVNAKRNLYFSMIQLRKAVKDSGRYQNVDTSLTELTDFITGHCEVESCEVEEIDQSMVNYEFVNSALDLRSTLDVLGVLREYEVKATYKYMMLLYLDILIVEQKLIESQYDVLANSTLEIKNLLDENPWISNEEKEYLFQLTLNIGGRWVKARDQRRLILATTFKKTLSRLNDENTQLQGDLNEYRSREQNTKSNESKDFQAQLNKLVKEMKELGVQMNTYSQNPFITGTALSNYYLGEKTLLLTRDTYFQMKANKLSTTEEIADYQHRLKVLRGHGTNILRQLLMALKQQVENDGGVGVQNEEPKHKKTIEELLRECAGDSTCLAKRLEDNKTNLSSIFIENFKFTTELFKKSAYLHALEVQSVYQLVQLIYLEVLKGRIKVGMSEFSVFYQKQIGIKESISENMNLSEIEKKTHGAIVSNTVKKWKLKIAKRKFDFKENFLERALEVATKNKTLVENREQITSELKSPKCKTTIFSKDRQRCKVRMEFIKNLDLLKDKENRFFIHTEEQNIPEFFWENI